MRSDGEGGGPPDETAPIGHHHVAVTDSIAYTAPPSSDRSDGHPELTSAERFERFHATNPHIYDLLVGYCRAWAGTGRVLFGIRAPWERMRWELGVHTDSTDFKLNDHYTSFYARLIVEQEPDLAALLSLRQSVEADEWIAARRVAVGESFALFSAVGV